MNEQAEYTPPVTTPESEGLVDSLETANETRESASHAAAILALNEAAVTGDWTQDRVDVAKAHIDTQFIPTETHVEVGHDLVGALETAHQESRVEAPSHAAALAALDEEKKRSELLSINESAARSDWSQDRIDAAQAQVEARYSVK